MSVVRSREVVRISEVRDTSYKSVGAFDLSILRILSTSGGSVKRGSTVLAVVVELEALALTRVSLLYVNACEMCL